MNQYIRFVMYLAFIRIIFKQVHLENMPKRKNKKAKKVKSDVTLPETETDSVGGRISYVSQSKTYTGDSKINNDTLMETNICVNKVSDCTLPEIGLHSQLGQLYACVILRTYILV